MNDNLYLCFINLIGEESDGEYRYEFIFTKDEESAWGENFDYKPSCLCNYIMVDDEYIDKVMVVKTKIKLDLIQNNCCFSVSDAYDGIVAIAYENLEGYEEYPQDGRIFFKFGETYEEVEKKLAIKNLLMQEKND